MVHAVFDLHCDTADRLAWQTLPEAFKLSCGMPFYGPGDELQPSACRELGSNRCQVSLDRIGVAPWAQCFACFIPDELSCTESLAFYRHVEEYLDRQVSKNTGRIAFARTGGEVEKLLDSGKVAALRTVENARFFALDPSYVDTAAQSGVIMASLSWNAAGPLASGHDTAEGLSSAGRAALARMVRAGMTIDVSHLNDRCFSEVAAATDTPLVASHSNSRSVCGHPRNLTDAQFREIVDRGGLVGLNFATIFISDDARPTFDDLSRHIDRFLERGGEDALALGSDFDGCDTPEFIRSASDMPSFQELLNSRFGMEITAKLCGENALRFFSNH